MVPAIDREANAKNGSLAYPAFYINIAPVVPDDPIADGQTQPGPPALRLGTEKRVKDTCKVLLRDAAPGVGNGNDQPGATIGPHPGDFHADFAALWHGVSRIVQQVHEYLFQAVGVSGD